MEKYHHHLIFTIDDTLSKLKKEAEAVRKLDGPGTDYGLHIANGFNYIILICVILGLVFMGYILFLLFFTDSHFLMQEMENSLNEMNRQVPVSDAVAGTLFIFKIAAVFLFVVVFILLILISTIIRKNNRLLEMQRAVNGVFREGKKEVEEDYLMIEKSLAAIWDLKQILNRSEEQNEFIGNTIHSETQKLKSMNNLKFLKWFKKH